MEAIFMRTCTCDNCHQIIEDESLKSCPFCGHVGKTVNLTITENVRIYDSLNGSVVSEEKGKSKRKYVIKEFFCGHEKFIRTGQVVYKIRIIDREHSEYYERVTRACKNDLIHFCWEPLKQHYGHGSDKKKKKGLVIKSKKWKMRKRFHPWKNVINIFEK